MDKSLIHDTPQVSTEKNAYLAAPYTEDEVREVVFQMEHTKPLDRMVFQQSFIKTSGR
jgi:hypothetical protein